MGENSVTVSFDENGSEYTGYFTATGFQTLAFNETEPNSLWIDGVKITLDERISGIDIDGVGQQTVAESWKFGSFGIVRP